MNMLYKYLILISFISLLGCTDNTYSPLRIGTNIWLGYEPLYLAREKQFLDSDKIHLVEFSSASQVIQAYRNELIDAAALTLDEVLLLLESDEKFTIVLVMDISNGGDAIIAQSNIKSINEMKGKIIGVENNALGAYVISRALEISETSSESVNIVNVDYNEQENAFTQKKVDIVVTFEPVLSKLLKQGANVIFNSKQIPGEIVDVLIVRDQYLQQHHTKVQALLDAWYQSLNFKEKEPMQAAKILGKRMQLNIKDTIAAYNGVKLPNQKENLELITGNKPKLLITVKKLANVMLKQKLLKTKIDPLVLFKKSKLKHR